MTPSEVFDDFQSSFQSRKFTAGLLLAFIDFLVELNVPALGLSSFEDFLIRFKRQTMTAAGTRANTLIVDRGGGQTLSIRPFYNRAERYFRAEKKRFDYPSCAPHATQAWSDYISWLDALVTFRANDLVVLRARICEFVLAELESHEFDPSSVKIEPPLFRLLLEEFDLSKHKAERTGAAFQGIVFGFLRADDPYLQMEIEKVRTGSKRLQRVGDIDGWEGAHLAVSVEVKQYVLSHDDIGALEAFANETGRRAALGIVAALGFSEGVRERLELIGVRSLDIGDMRRSVALWHPLKQRAAISSLIYYVRHVEKSAALAKRIEAFLDSAASEWSAQPGEAAEQG